MEIKVIVSEINQEIARLERARALLAGKTQAKSAGTAKKKNPAGVSLAAKAGPKRKLSPEGRKRIAEAMKRRWAERKKAAKQPK